FAFSSYLRSSACICGSKLSSLFRQAQDVAFAVAEVAEPRAAGFAARVIDAYSFGAKRFDLRIQIIRHEIRLRPTADVVLRLLARRMQIQPELHRIVKQDPIMGSGEHPHLEPKSVLIPFGGATDVV